MSNTTVTKHEPHSGRFTGKNPEITAIFDCQAQAYTVYKNGEVLISNKHKFSDIESYLN